MSRKKDSWQNGTIAAVIFGFLVIRACSEFIFKNAIIWKYVIISFGTFYPKFMLILNNIFKICTKIENFERNVNFSKM